MLNKTHLLFLTVWYGPLDVLVRRGELKAPFLHLISVHSAIQCMLVIQMRRSRIWRRAGWQRHGGWGDGSCWSRTYTRRGPSWACWPPTTSGRFAWESSSLHSTTGASPFLAIYHDKGPVFPSLHSEDISSSRRANVFSTWYSRGPCHGL